ncbi:ATP-binding cassette domain-containing protein [Caulobacter sp. CCUG 60055]|uniref:methionine ABC transporter ATP-binding protein n=1 Tax=Caulobacter sp. CCUG 60055 TaxID=2100090 RepID=UPI001FA6CF8A|nr:ATP-binding cassette domain-containing protein [Caulobacter sp. CCUG 60055]
MSDIHKTYRAGSGEVAALRGIDLRVAAGEVFGVIGQSGAGKSSLIRMINLLERPTAGRVTVDGVDAASLDAAGLRGLRRRIGMIFQHFNLLSSKTVVENVAFPLQLEGRLAREDIRARALALLDRVDLADQADKYPAQLSGGQKQRVGVARALACEPKILLCDEATSALDPETTRQVLRLLRELNGELGLTIVLITHEMDVIRRVCDRVAVLEAGRVVEQGVVADVFLSPRHATTRRLIEEGGDADDAGAGGPGAGRTVRLTYRGETTYAPLLGRIARETGVDYSILGGRVAHIRDLPYGQLTLALVGGDVDAALAQFAAAGVAVEEIDR